MQYWGQKFDLDVSNIRETKRLGAFIGGSNVFKKMLGAIFEKIIGGTDVRAKEYWGGA